MFKKLKYVILATLLAGSAFAVPLNDYPPGFRLIDGSQLNLMVDQVNNLTGNGTAGTQAVTGVANGYKIARGETVLNATVLPTAVATGLTSIVACTMAIKSATTSLSTSVLTYQTATATLSVYGWRPTSNSNPTLLASPEPTPFGWICLGT